MLTCRIRPFFLYPAFCIKNAPKSVKEISSRKLWTDEQKHQNAENEKFFAFLPEVVTSVSKTKILKNLPETKKFSKKLLEYNLAGGKKIRGLMTVAAYQMLEKPENITEESLRLARSLGWCIELLQSVFMIQDDIMDNSVTRRGSICWYQLPDVGMRAVNDSTHILALLFAYLKNNFSGKQYYSKLLDFFNEATLYLTTGQHLDAVSARNISVFTEKNYHNLTNHKMVYYTFKLPVYISLLLANKSFEGVYENEEDLLLKIGILILMQNDYLDCFGEAVTGKAGTDIQEGKCTWLALQALARCSPAQRAEFTACYGKPDAQCVQRVKQLYERLQLPALYRDAERAAYDDIVKRINEIPADNVIPPALMLKLFHSVYQLWDKSENRPYLGGVY